MLGVCEDVLIIGALVKYIAIARVDPKTKMVKKLGALHKSQAITHNKYKTPSKI